MFYIDSACSYKELYDPEHVYVFTGPCKVTGKPQKVAVPAKELFALRQGAHIQNACPSLSAGDREFITNGTSDEGWRQLFGPDEEE